MLHNTKQTDKLTTMKPSIFVYEIMLFNEMVDAQRQMGLQLFDLVIYNTMFDEIINEFRLTADSSASNKCPNMKHLE